MLARMARFIHLAPEPLAKRIRRNGIQPTRAPAMMARLGLTGIDRAVWAFPVTPSFTLSHQWLRELKREGVRTLVAVSFRLDDDEPVLARHYSKTPQPMTAAVQEPNRNSAGRSGDASASALTVRSTS